MNSPPQPFSFILPSPDKRKIFDLYITIKKEKKKSAFHKELNVMLDNMY
jgi:hypothetical protein